jgi:hypothetical protein
VLLCWVRKTEVQPAPSFHTSSFIAAAGHELGNDTYTLDLPVWDSKTNRTVLTATNRAVVIAIVSPEPNHYSLVPAEFTSVYEQVSIAWMLSREVSGCTAVGCWWLVSFL